MILLMISWDKVAGKIRISSKQQEKVQATEALMLTKRSIYEGTASKKAVSARRAKNKVARRSRRINRS